MLVYLLTAIEKGEEWYSSTSLGKHWSSCTKSGEFWSSRQINGMMHTECLLVSQKHNEGVSCLCKWKGEKGSNQRIH